MHLLILPIKLHQTTTLIRLVFLYLTKGLEHEALDFSDKERRKERVLDLKEKSGLKLSLSKFLVNLNFSKKLHFLITRKGEESIIIYISVLKNQLSKMLLCR